jgi:hypothetical protein
MHSRTANTCAAQIVRFLSARVVLAAALPGCLFLLQSLFQSSCFFSQYLIDARIPGQFPQEFPVCIEYLADLWRMLDEVQNVCLEQRYILF